MPSGAKRFFKLFAKNLKEAKGPGQYSTNGIAITCVHCYHNQFKHGYALLNTSLMSFLNLDFANRSANTLTCDRCGYIHWFNKEIDRI
ncbi:hypothetical protein M3194_12990 [Paenibacillus glycanilyticus]|uniref:hypothetical protein n=1 Tax=Paenibacillus glycanilyticus TaxID=126569 RepID=UPI00204228FF|nr:hypothetical protein [Paenibacillus glycanilyticus]MCM3628281.1 hypothetical protein [Paenibacillus glycanilyticus]